MLVLDNINKNIDKLFAHSEIINSNILVFKPIEFFDNTNIDALLVQSEIIIFINELLRQSSFSNYMIFETFKVMVDIKCTEYYKSKCILIEIDPLDVFKRSFYTHINNLVEKYTDEYNSMCLI
jgi:hypothetical protein